MAAYVQDALTSECQRWLADADEFRGGFLAAMPGDVESGVRRRLRSVLARVIGDSGDRVAACQPGSLILAERLQGAFDEVYDREAAQARGIFTVQYGERFDRINWVGERLMDAIWLEDALAGAAPEEMIASLRRQYDKEYGETIRRREVNFQELERLRLANAATMEEAKEESRRLITIATTEAVARHDEELIKLEGIKEQAAATVRNAELAGNAAIRAAELDSETRLRAAELTFEQAIEHAILTGQTELEKARIEAGAKVTVANIERERDIKKARIERKGSTVSSIVRAIGGMGGGRGGPRSGGPGSGSGR